MDELKETFIDMNMSTLLELHEELVQCYVDMGFLSTSTSYDFIHCIVDHIDFNERISEYSSDDE